MWEPHGSRQGTLASALGARIWMITQEITFGEITQGREGGISQFLRVPHPHGVGVGVEHPKTALCRGSIAMSRAAGI